jgi:hypothetical protein
MKQVQKEKDPGNPIYFFSGPVFALSCTSVAFEWRFPSFFTNGLPGNPITVFTSEMNAFTIAEPPGVHSPAINTKIRPDDLIQITDKPEIDRNAKNERIGYIQFVVDENGRVKDGKIQCGANSRLDKEALRVVNQMPLGMPGKQGLKHAPVV